MGLRRRIPAKLVEFMGRKELKFSLKTKDWDGAVLLCNEESMKLERIERRGGQLDTVVRLHPRLQVPTDDEFNPS